MIHSSERNTVQTAYELTLYESGKKVWASGIVRSKSSTDVEIPYQLKPATAYSWSVRIWDNHGQKSGTGKSTFSTGLRPEDWEAQWIGSPKFDTPLYFASSLTLGRSIRSATLYITSHGLYEAVVNDDRVGDAYLTPGWTSYHKRLQYQAYDLTPMLRKGNNSIEVLVTPGWFCGGMNYGKRENRYRYGDDLMLLAQVNIVYSDGKTEVWGTNPDWKMSEGEVTFANIYDGETINYNVGREWKNVMVADLAKNNLVASESEGVTRSNPLRPIQSIVSPKGEKILDFGQNLTGWERVHVRGNKGDTVRVYHAEILDNDGNFYTSNLRSAKATSTFVLSGGDDVFEPSHTFYGFRYIKVEGIDGELNMDDFEAIPVYSGFSTTGHFRSSNELVNQLQSNIEWGFHSNFVDVPTDCPQRDERLGWTGDAQVFFRTASFLGDVDRFFVKWLKDVAADQRSDGAVPRTVPDTFTTTKDGKEDRSRVGALGWADCATIIPWNHYMAYGDVTVLENQYESMRKWVDFVISESEPNGYLWKCDRRRHYGDWLFWSVNNDRSGESAITNMSLLGQCFFAGSLSNLISAAKVLGREDDATVYAKIREKVVDAYLREYVTPNGHISSDTQTAYVLALHFGLLPEHLRKQAVDRLVANIRQYRYHITTGFLGTPYICNVLTDNGRSDIAYRLLLQETCPGWLYPVTRGATTIWERWDSILPDGTIPENGMNSFNHYSYGAIGDWLYRSAVGIRESSPGYSTIVIKPHVGGNFTFMGASTLTPYGEVSAEWSADGNVLRTLDVVIPENTTAEVYVPAYSADCVSSDAGTEGVFEKGYVKYCVGSGTYSFKVR